MPLWFWIAVGLAVWMALGLLVGLFVGGAARLGEPSEQRDVDMVLLDVSQVDWSAWPDYRKDRAA